ncbi:MAG: hypothetical protein GXO93_05385 [FCB group bacterium]|nr:hypothetical protein [FCB group bacterium]
MRKGLSLFFILIIVGMISLFHGLSVLARSQTELKSYPPSDTVFDEINLSDQGVEAVDTAGYDWYYDFDKGVFVLGSNTNEESGSNLESSQKANIENYPIEERCVEEKKVKPFVRSVLVGYDEYVDGDIIAYGRVTVKGWVRGDVKSINKRVLVTSTGRVDGDIEAPEIIIRDGGIVKGRQVITGNPGLIKLKDITSTFSVDGIIVVISFTFFFLFFGFLIISLMPRQLRNFNQCFYRQKVKTYFIGFFFILLMGVIMLIVTITIVGIVLIPFIPFLYLFAIIMGVVSFGNGIGKIISRQWGSDEKGIMWQSFLGILVFMSLWLLVAVLLGANNNVSEGFGILFLVIAIIISTYPVCSGVGAAVLTRFGFKPCTTWEKKGQWGKASSMPTPAPPPIPENPFDTSQEATGPQTNNPQEPPKNDNSAPLS